MLWRKIKKGKEKWWKEAYILIQGRGWKEESVKQKHKYLSQQPCTHLGVEKEPATWLSGGMGVGSGGLGQNILDSDVSKWKGPETKLEMFKNSKKASVTGDKKSSTYNKCVLILQEKTEVEHLKNESMDLNTWEG